MESWECFDFAKTSRRRSQTSSENERPRDERPSALRSASGETAQEDHRGTNSLRIWLRRIAEIGLDSPLPFRKERRDFLVFDGGRNDAVFASDPVGGCGQLV